MTKSLKKKNDLNKSNILAKKYNFNLDDSTENKKFLYAIEKYLTQNGGQKMFEKAILYLAKKSKEINSVYKLLKSKLNNTFFSIENVRKYQISGTDDEIKQIVITSYIAEFLTNRQVDAMLFLALAGQESEWKNVKNTPSKGVWQLTTSSSVNALKNEKWKKKVKEIFSKAGFENWDHPILSNSSNWKYNIFFNGMAMLETIALKIAEKEWESGFYNLSDERKLKEILYAYNGNSENYKNTDKQIRQIFPNQCFLLYNHLIELKKNKFLN